ncbi:MAG TPA: hypothetical protein VFZ59_15220 [Verrucomicrobiae bacterium]|nr:hypothetical protein [Verrucomicrobiae bacterium]
MKTSTRSSSALALLLLVIAVPLQAQTTAFTYQGRLDLNGSPVSGLHDLRFTVYDAADGGSIAGGPLTNASVNVSNGLFVTGLDFGAGVFTGPARWLQIEVRTNGGGSFALLTPRQALTATPYAIHAGNASNVVSGAAVKSLNNLRDNVTLAVGANMTLATNGNTLTLSSSGPAGAVWSLNGTNTYYNGGNVGIGTSVPNERLTIGGVSSYNNGLKLTGGTASGTGMTLENTAAGGRRYSLLSGGSFTGVGAGGFGIFDDTVGDYRLAIGSTGNVGIGTTSPASKLDIAAQDALRIAGFQPFITMSDLNGFGLIRKANRYLQVVDGDLAFLYRPECNTFPCNQATESHMTIRFNGNVGIGTSIPQAKLDVIGTTRTSVLTITGGADIAEPFKMSSPEIPKGSVVVIDELNPGHLKLSGQAYDKRVAGIVSGANGIRPGISLHQEGAIEGGENVALSGRAYVQADAEYGDIKPGDLLTTSETPGHAMKVVDHGRAQGAILGKAMTGLKEGKGMVLVLVTLQ